MDTSTTETELLTVAEAAEFLKLAKHTVYRLVASGEIPASRIGGSVRVDRAELFAAVAAKPIVVRVPEENRGPQMMVATRRFKFSDAYGSGEVVKGERVDPSHELVKMFPDAWRPFTVQDELRVRSDRVAELREAAARPAGRAPVSEAGKREAREADFWRSTTALLERTAPDQPTSAERREDAFLADAQRQIEDLEAARMRGELAEIQGMYYGRLAD